MNCQQLDNCIFYFLLAYAFVSTISIAASNIVISLAIIAGIIRWWKWHVTFYTDKRLINAVGIFLLVCIITGFLGSSPTTSIVKVWGFFYRMVPFLLVGIFINDSKKLSLLTIAIVISMLISDAYAIWQGLHGIKRAGGFGNYMILGGHLLMVIPLCMIMTFEEKAAALSKKYFFGISMVVSLVALYFNGTRGAWLSVVLSIIVYGILNIKKNRRIAAATLLIIIVCGIIATNVPEFQNRLLSIADMKNQSNAERFYLWQSSWNMFKDHPLTGIGVGTFKHVYNTQYILPEAKEPGLGHAHNNFIHILAEAGIIGLMAFIYMFGCILATSFKKYMHDKANVQMLAVFLITISLLQQGLTEYNFDDSAVIRLYWFIMGIAFTGQHIMKGKLYV